MPNRARWAFGFAGACAAMVGLLWVAAFHVGFVERADQKVLFAFYSLTSLSEQHRVHVAASFLVSLCDPSRFVFLAAVPVVRRAGATPGLRRRRGRCAARRSGRYDVGAEACASRAIPERTSPVPYPRFPSGHSTAAMSLVLALTLVAPARLRPLIAGLGAVFAAAVGYALLTLGSHYPTDVFGGFLVATTWALLTAGALSGSRAVWARSARSSRRSLVPGGASHRQSPHSSRPRFWPRSSCSATLSRSSRTSAAHRVHRGRAVDRGAQHGGGDRDRAQRPALTRRRRPRVRPRSRRPTSTSRSPSSA